MNMIDCFRIMSFSFLQIGMIQITCGFLTYFTIMADYGFFPGQLIRIRKKWESPFLNDLLDSYGQEWVCNFIISIRSKQQNMTAYFLLCYSILHPLPEKYLVFRRKNSKKLPKK